MDKYLFIFSLFSPIFFAVLLLSLLLTKLNNNLYKKFSNHPNYWLITLIIGIILIALNIFYNRPLIAFMGVVAITSQSLYKFRQLKQK